jgi:UDP-GlcNAc3NAcA epimerase
MKIVTVVGARPQFVKAAVISREIERNKEISEIIIHTGQHYDFNMSEIFFQEMIIPRPNYNLAINGLRHGAMTGQMLEKIEKVLIHERPDWVLVYGDTNSTLAGALAAKKLRIKVAHVEAGLRSFNMNMPEEINRILTDRISDLLFCPTPIAIKNLKSEGFDELDNKIILSGDVMHDAALFYSDKARQPLIEIPNKYILCTIHREENTDDQEKLMSIFKALESISSVTKILLPLHPRTKSKLESINFPLGDSKIQFMEPLGYLEMVYLLKNCLLVMTDSGGLQKEAYFFKKYCITLREETEWVELVENKVNFLAGSSPQLIIDCFNASIAQDKTFTNTEIFGNGNSAEFIIKSLLNSYCETNSIL